MRISGGLDDRCAVIDLGEFDKTAQNHQEQYNTTMGKTKVQQYVYDQIESKVAHLSASVGAHQCHSAALVHTQVDIIEQRWT